jgi:hypothetical protein
MCGGGGMVVGAGLPVECDGIFIVSQSQVVQARMGGQRVLISRPRKVGEPPLVLEVAPRPL